MFETDIIQGGNNSMNSKFISGMVLISLMVVLAGVLSYNFHPTALEVNNYNINSNPSSNQMEYNVSSNTQPNSKISSSFSSTTTKSDTSQMNRVLTRFNRYVNSLFPKTGVPGSAVLIVHNGKIVYLNCLGVKDITTKSPVNPYTLFQIGSCSKAFTSAMIAKLVDEGKMNWNDTVRSYFTPAEFQLYSKTVSNKITIADCLCHRSGLPMYSGDDLWLYYNNTFPEGLYKMRYVENNTKFRSTWNYNNVMYALAGECAARATGKSYSQLMKEEIFQPLNMKFTTTSYIAFINAKNRVQPYYHQNQNKLIPFSTDLSNVKPAGSISSSILDMANWIKFQLANGKFNGKQVVSRKELTVTKTPQIPTGNRWYGYGWGISHNGTLTIVTHLGDAAPSRTDVCIYPQENLGIISVSNEGTYGQYFNRALVSVFQQLYFQGRYDDPWPEFKQKGDEELKSTEGKLPAHPKVLVAPNKASTYTGVYTTKFNGNIFVKYINKRLVLYLGHSKVPIKLKHWSGNTFSITSGNDPESYGMPLYFYSVNKGKAQKVKIPRYDHGYGMNGTFTRVY